MRVVVTGARGYLGSRLVPELLRRGHEVVATASSDPTDPSRPVRPWAGRVQWAVMDALRDDDIAAAVAGADAVVYLLHSLDQPGFEALDREAAVLMRSAVDETGVGRLVYLSGLVPDTPREQLSAHLASRLEVEEILLESSGNPVALRAGVVLGAGSTSFEILRQLAATLVVQPLPSWLNSRVQPIGVSDAVTLLADAVERDEPRGSVDVGGPVALPYAELMRMYCQEANLLRVRLPAPLLPGFLVARGAPLACAAPARTVTSLVESLRHDMVCRPERWWRLTGGETSVREAIRASLGGVGDPRLGAHRPMVGDPAWVDPTLLPERVLGRRLPVPEVVRHSLHAGVWRVRGLLG